MTRSPPLLPSLSRRAALMLLLLSLGISGCQVSAQAGQNAASIIGRGVVNNPKNMSLRFDMLKFGLKEFCRELTEQGAPLRLEDGQPVIGRFFGKTCQAKSIDTVEKKTVVVQFGGAGYAWTPGTGRLGFRAQGLLELSPDFRVHKEAMYVYFRPVQVDTSDFEVLMTERPLAQAVIQLAGVDETKMGQSIINAQLGRGFTAIRYDVDGHTDFALGIVDEGDTPFRPFTVVSSPRLTAANGRTELSAGQQDYIGQVKVEEGETIAVTLNMEGTEAIDFALVTAPSAEPILDSYVRTRGSKMAPVVPSFVARAASGAPTRAEVRVPAGRYYLVLDHSTAWGATTPQKEALPARVDYLIQTGVPQKS